VLERRVTVLSVTEHRQLKQIKLKINPPASSSDRSEICPPAYTYRDLVSKRVIA
jgi:hypothetical protein